MVLKLSNNTVLSEEVTLVPFLWLGLGVCGCVLWLLSYHRSRHPVLNFTKYQYRPLRKHSPLSSISSLASQSGYGSMPSSANSSTSDLSVAIGMEFEEDPRILNLGPDLCIIGFGNPGSLLSCQEPDKFGNRE